MTHDASHGLGRGLGAPAATGDPPILAVALTPEIAQKARRWLMVTGVLALLAGVVSILVPAVTSVTIAILVGVVLIVIAFPMAASAWAVPRRGRRALRLIEASLALIAGVCLVAFPLEGTLTLTFFLAAWFFATGALLVAAAPELRGTPMFWPTLLHGLISLLLGILIVADLPSSAAWAIGLLVGVNLVFYGVRALIAARELKQAAT